MFRKAVILAGGLGHRLKPFTEVIPKPLLPIGESSVLEIQIDSLRKYGIRDIYIATNYKSAFIEAFLGDGSKYGVSIKYSREEKPLGTCGPITLLADMLNEPFILMNGDILTTLNFGDLYDFFRQVESPLTVVSTEIVTPFQFGKIISDGDYIGGIQEKPDIKFEILAGIYVFQPELLSMIPFDSFFGMDDLIRLLLGKNIKIAKYKMKDYWLDIGRLNDYETAQSAYNDHFKGR
mgnify:CR=1 FL=1